MTDKSKVSEYLIQISKKSEEELEAFSGIIDFGIKTVFEMLKSSEYENDERILFLTAAFINTFISECSDGSAQITSFSAGDVSITQSAASSSADEIYKKAYEAASGLINDGAFAFMGI